MPAFLKIAIRTPTLPFLDAPYHTQNTREEYTEAFRAIDRNKSGTIDIQELNRLMAAMDFGLSGQELENIFSTFDKDGNGEVDTEDFVNFMMHAW